jgi:hypothetical protein
MVGVQGFEPWTPCSQSRCATRLRYTPTEPLFYTVRAIEGKSCKIRAMVAYFSSKLKKQFIASFAVVLLFTCVLGTHSIGYSHGIAHAGLQTQSASPSIGLENSTAFTHSSDICHLFDALTLASFALLDVAVPIIFLVLLSRVRSRLKTRFIAPTRVTYQSRAPPAAI